MKNLIAFITYQHFKMEGLHLINDIFLEGDFMSKTDLKDAYFSVTININYIKYLRFVLEGD